MNFRGSYLIAASILLLAGVTVTSPSARAADQIVLIQDAQGRKIYINTGNPLTGLRGRSLRFSSLISPPAEIDRAVQDTARRLQMDPQLIRAIIQVESDYNTNAQSRKGAMGLMQLVPTTAQRFGVRNPYNAKQNIEGGVNYLKYLLELFKGDIELSLAAYNAGEHSVLRAGSVPEISETKNYVRKVTDLYSPGAKPTSTKPKEKAAYKAPIYRYVDARGVIHYTNGDEL